MDNLSRIELNKRCVEHVRVARGTRPDLKLIDLDGRMLALKDYHNSDRLFRNIVGPLLIRREAGALRKLTGVQGIPQLYRVLDKHALLMEYVDGSRLRDLPKDTIGPEFYDRLADLLRRMHAVGVAHCDLRAGSNILVGKDSLPYVIDFVSSVFKGRGLNPLIRLLFREFTRADLYAVMGLKKRFSPSSVTPEEEAALAKSLPFERPAIFLGKSIRNLTRRFLTRAKN